MSGRCILITGAAAGIGHSVALHCARHGAQLVLLDRNERGLNELYDRIELDGGPQPVIVTLDLARTGAGEAQALAEQIEKEFGRLDGLLHNAAELGVLAPLEHYDPELWVRVLQVNLNTAFLITRSCLPLLKRSADASVLFTSARVGREGKAYWGAYAVAAAGVEGLMRTLAAEFSGEGNLRVNSIDPGTVRTELRSRAYPGEIPQDLAAPDILAPAYLYLLGPDSRGVHGRALSLQKEG
jgi:NAD(P)-dependent dehydrogenase (short-subunit alcohol dehydrogenase family)